MKRILPLLCCVFACTYLFAQKDCRHNDYTSQLLSDHPELEKKAAAIESFIYQNTGDRRTVTAGTGTTTAAVPETITIPVVVHVLYNTEAQNISDAQVLAQIEVLNKDFRKLNQDKINVPAHFASLAADCGIEFKLARTDPAGKSTNGIVRRKTSIQNFGMDDRAKFSDRGGDNAWDAGKYLNIWVCNLAGGLIGYASLMGCEPAIDGIVIATHAFGLSGSGTYNKGRTATHEVGHWLNLRHIWGDTYCGDDKVEDTPNQRSPNRGCPSGKNITCGNSLNGDMYMNFMDLTNDACMYMFTMGQRERMRALFLPGGQRNSLIHSNVLTVSDIPQPAALPEINNDVLNDEIQAFPNPAANTLTVKLNKNQPESAAVFIVFNHLGQPVQRYTLNGPSGVIDISHLKNGIYYLKAPADKAAKGIKFVKIN